MDYFGDRVGLTPTPVAALLANPSLIPQQGVNFAVGGAQTAVSSSFPGISNIPIPGTLGQVATLTQTSPLDPNAIYAVSGGGNDYFQGDN
ncbi:MAG: hypothetical protein HC908_14280 [Calothrix sp. SM1_7_51]|nr:hypothetical protein [Calothrix sp. SM1_7_51]